MPTLTENIDRINKLAKELNVDVKFDREHTEIIIKNRNPKRIRTRTLIDLRMENIEDAMHWVAEK